MFLLWLLLPLISSPPRTTPAQALPSQPDPAPALPSQLDSSPPSEDLSSPVSSHTHSCLNLEPLDSHICPLWEVVGAEDVIRVHVSFSLTDLSSIEKCLGSFSTNPTNFIKEFQYLVQAYDLTWHDLHIILTSTMTLDKRDRIRTAARAHSDHTHTTNPLMPVGAEAVPEVEPGWNYQVGQAGWRHCNQMVKCLIAGMHQSAQKAVNYDKLREVTQGPGENPALFFNRLTEAMMLHTSLDSASNAGATVLAPHFISQLAPDIRRKFKKAEDGPQAPIQDLVNMAFKLFNNQEARQRLPARHTYSKRWPCRPKPC